MCKYVCTRVYMCVYVCECVCVCVCVHLIVYCAVYAVRVQRCVYAKFHPILRSLFVYMSVKCP